jgi:hypothetical protein
MADGLLLIYVAELATSVVLFLNGMALAGYFCLGVAAVVELSLLFRR